MNMETMSVFPFASLLYFVLVTVAAYRLKTPHLPHYTAPQHTPPPRKSSTQTIIKTVYNEKVIRQKLKTTNNTLTVVSAAAAALR